MSRSKTMNYKAVSLVSFVLILLFSGYKYVVLRYFTNDTQTTSPINSDSFTFSDDDIYGIDVSHYQKKIDWKKVANNSNPNVEFVYIKCSEGVTWKDKRFQYNYKNAVDNGLRVGVYHFFSHSTTGKNQFKEFSRVYPGSRDDLPIMVDCERLKGSKKSYLKQLQIFLDLCEDHYGSKPIIYSTQRFYNTYLSGSVNDYDLMIGRYNNKKHEPHLLDGRSWDIWQFSEKGQVDGIPEPVDLDVAKTRFWE